MRGHRWTFIGLAVYCLFLSPASADSNTSSCQNNQSLFLPQFQYPIPWWVVLPSDVPQVANTALTLRSALTTSYEDFAQQILVAVANNKTTDIAKSIGYMINANATLGGGCPVPPPPNTFLRRVGEGLAATVEYASDLTGLIGDATEASMGVSPGGFNRINSSAVTDTVLGAMFVAGRSCGPPNALSSSTLAAIRQKYIDSVCYYAGPILRSITNNNTDNPPCYNGTFEADIVLANKTDVYVSGPLLSAYKECVVGPPELMNPPSWLNYSFGPVVSIDSGGGGLDTVSEGSSAASSSSAGAGGGSVSLNSIPSDSGATTAQSNAADTAAMTAQSSNIENASTQQSISLNGGRRRILSWHSYKWKLF